MIEVITESNLGHYISLLTEDEVYRIADGLYSSLGDYDTEKKSPTGVMVAEILPDEICIRKLTTAIPYRDRGVASRLLSIVTSGSDGLPVTVYDPPSDEWLLDHDFIKRPTDYRLYEARLGDIRRLPVSKDSRSLCRICRMDEVPEASLERYVMPRLQRPGLSFPDYEITSERFSECSPMAMIDDRICGAIFYEEIDNTILIRWFGADNTGVLYMLFSSLRTQLEMDYERRTRLCFLSNDNNDPLGDIIDKYDTKTVVSYVRNTT